MTEVTRILSQIESGDPSAAEPLLMLVYDELRQLAATKLANEKTGQTLQPTALVHEAYIRLVNVETPQKWNGRGHFFAAAAEAMRRILIEQARRKASLKAGGKRRRVDLSNAEPETLGPQFDWLALDEALRQLEAKDSRAATLVKLRFFAGFTMQQAAEALNISVATAENDWAYARSWLRVQMNASNASDQ